MHKLAAIPLLVNIRFHISLSRKRRKFIDTISVLCSPDGRNHFLHSVAESVVILRKRLSGPERAAYDTMRPAFGGTEMIRHTRRQSMNRNDRGDP